MSWVKPVKPEKPDAFDFFLEGIGEWREGTFNGKYHRWAHMYPEPPYHQPYRYEIVVRREVVADINELVEWCRDHLRHGTWGVHFVQPGNEHTAHYIGCMDDVDAVFMKLRWFDGDDENAWSINRNCETISVDDILARLKEKTTKDVADGRGG